MLIIAAAANPMPLRLRKMVGSLNHEAATGRFPTGGWGYSWVGDPDRGNDWRQPGGWIYNLLPFMEQQALHDLPSGKSGEPLLDAVTQMMQTPLDGLICPTRRRAVLYDAFARTRYSDSSPFIVYKLALTDYTIDGKVHDYLGNRKDGKVIDTSRS